MGILEQQDRDMFEKHIDLYNQWKSHKFIKNYTKEVYQDFDYLYKKFINSFNPHKHWCSTCRTDLIEELYRWYSFQPKEQELPVWINEESKTIINTQPKKRGRKPKRN